MKMFSSFRSGKNSLNKSWQYLSHDQPPQVQSLLQNNIKQLCESVVKENKNQINALLKGNVSTNSKIMLSM